MSLRNRRDKIIPFPDKHNQKGGKKPKVPPQPISTVAEKILEDSSQDHLIPVRFPYDAEDDPPCRIGNVPWTELGSLYVLKMRQHFPDCWLLSDTSESCAIGRITFTGLCEVPEDADTFGTPPGSKVSFLRVRVCHSGKSRTVEVANIIADPFGLKVFRSLVEAHPNRLFQTIDLELLPIAAIDPESLKSPDFSA